MLILEEISMRFKKPLRGPYEKVNLAFMRERAGRCDDPRHAFYIAILSCDSFDSYYSAAGEDCVQPSTTSYKVNADMEIKYALKNRWLVRP